MNKSVKLKDGFNQVCVWPGTIIEKDQIEDLEKEMIRICNTKIQYLETIKTTPDTDRDGFEVAGTGGRIDVFFAVHKDDVGKFALPKLEMGIRWLEDVLAKGNYRCPIYPDHVYNYVSWLVEDIDFPEGVCCAL
jgi:hypothetical protein